MNENQKGVYRIIFFLWFYVALAIQGVVGQVYTIRIFSPSPEIYYQRYYTEAIVENKVSALTTAHFIKEPQKARTSLKVFFDRNGFQTKEWYYDDKRKEKVSIKDSILLDSTGKRYDLYYTAFGKAPYVKTIKVLPLEEEKEYLAHPDKFAPWMAAGFRYLKFMEANFIQQRVYNLEDGSPALDYIAKHDSLGNVIRRFVPVQPAVSYTLIYEYNYSDHTGISYYYGPDAKRYLYSVVELDVNNRYTRETKYDMEFTPDILTRVKTQEPEMIVEYDVRKNGLIDQVWFLKYGFPTTGIVFTYEYFHD